MRIQDIETSLQMDVAQIRKREAPASRYFLEHFARLVEHFDEVFSRYHRTATNLSVQSTESPDTRSLTGFVFADDIAETSRILELNPFAFDSLSFNPGRPIVEAHLAMRINPPDAFEAETRLGRAGILPITGQVDLYDDSCERSDYFWEGIRLPGAKPINFTDDIHEYLYGSGDLAHMILPKFSGLAARFDSMHAALDIVDATPVWSLE